MDDADGIYDRRGTPPIMKLDEGRWRSGRKADCARSETCAVGADQEELRPALCNVLFMGRGARGGSLSAGVTTNRCGWTRSLKTLWTRGHPSGGRASLCSGRAAASPSGSMEPADDRRFCFGYVPTPCAGAPDPSSRLNWSDLCRGWGGAKGSCCVRWRRWRDKHRKPRRPLHAGGKA